MLLYNGYNMTLITLFENEMVYIIVNYSSSKSMDFYDMQSS